MFQPIVRFVFQHFINNINVKVAKCLHLKFSLPADAPETDANCSSKGLNNLVFTFYFQKGIDFLQPFLAKRLFYPLFSQAMFE